jgi:hypothetical protein
MEKAKIHLEETNEVLEVEFCFCDRCVLLGQCVSVRGMSICIKCYKELYAAN